MRSKSCNVGPKECPEGTTTDSQKCQVRPKWRLGRQKYSPRGPSWTQEMPRGDLEAPRKPRREPQRRHVGPKRSPRAAKLRPRDVKKGSDGARIVPERG